jgi:hypothetical protein
LFPLSPYLLWRCFEYLRRTVLNEDVYLPRRSALGAWTQYFVAPFVRLHQTCKYESEESCGRTKLGGMMNGYAKRLTAARGRPSSTGCGFKRYIGNHVYFWNHTSTTTHRQARHGAAPKFDGFLQEGLQLRLLVRLADELVGVGETVLLPENPQRAREVDDQLAHELILGQVVQLTRLLQPTKPQFRSSCPTTLLRV